jgi:regulation of enolase protein 1 (concanavalin A-like superfamily)
MSRYQWWLVVVVALVACPITRAAEKKDGDQIKGWGAVVDPDRDCNIQWANEDLFLGVPVNAHDLSVEQQKMNSPRVLREVEGDFIAQVKVVGEFGPDKSPVKDRVSFQGAGLLLMKDDQTYVRLEHGVSFDPKSGQTFTYPSLELREDGSAVRLGHSDTICLEKQQMAFLRLERHGDKILGAVSPDGNKWLSLNPMTVTVPKKLRIGVAAVNTAGIPFVPRFSSLEVFQRK